MLATITFQVTDVKKLFMAADKFAEYGNLVQFDHSPEHNLIRSLDGQLQAPVIKYGPSFILQVECVKKSASTFTWLLK